MSARTDGLGQIIRAFLWLRWHLLANSLKRTSRRDRFEHLSRATSALLPIALAIVFIPALLVSCILALVGGYVLGARTVPTVGVVVALRVLLGVVCGAVVIAPAVRSIRGGSSGLSRFLLLPIPRTFLFLSDAASTLVDPWIALVIPILVLFPLGLAIAGRFASSVLALAAGIAMLATYIGLESSVSHLLRLLYRSRRRGEMATLVVVCGLSLSGFIPLLMTSKHHRIDPTGWVTTEPTVRRERSHASSSEETGAHRDSLPERDSSPDRESSPLKGRSPEEAASRVTKNLPWVPVFPSELYGRTIDLAVSGRPAQAGLMVAFLFGCAAALIGLGWSAHERLLDSPETGGRTRSRRKERLLGRRLLGLSPTTSALAIINVRLLLRSVQGKMSVYFTPVSLVVFLFLSTRLMSMDFKHLLGDNLGPALAVSGFFFSLLALQKIMVNQFAIDGAGLTLQLLAPISERDLVLGKAMGMGVLYSMSMVFYIVIAFAASPGASPWLWLAVVLMGISIYVLFAPFALMLSALFPKTADLSRIGKSGNPNGFAAFIGFFILMAVVAPPIGLATAALGVTESPVWVLGVMVAWFVVAAAVSILLFKLCERIVASRRENLGLTAQGR